MRLRPGRARQPMAIFDRGQIVPHESVSVTTDPDLETDQLAAGFKPARPFLLFAPASGAICTAAGPR